jgi:nucleotide-binding universal stress UspA family protein
MARELREGVVAIMPTFKHILVATDFSDAARAAVELARAMACECGASLTVVHVCEVRGASMTAPIPYERATPIVQRAEDQLDPVLEHVREACPRADGLVKMGAAAEQILATAGEVRADLIVLGTHGRRGFARAMMGSVAEEVVRLSPVPVLTLRARGAD